MTIEHKILTLIDRGVRAMADLDDLLAPQLRAYLTYMIDDGAIDFRRGHVSLTESGLERLNKLDGDSRND